MKKPLNKSATNRSATRSSPEDPIRQRARRLPAEERRGLILKEATVFFSEHGFAASTRDLADRLGVRQALLYKYFASKEALIETVFNDAFGKEWTEQWAHALSDTNASLVDRVNAFYSRYLDANDSLRLRLSLRGALDGYALQGRIDPLFETAFVAPLLTELRREAGLPDTSKRSMMAGERELIMMLHGAVMFYHIRKQVYEAKVVEDQALVTRLFVDTYLRGVRDSLKALHADESNAVLSMAE
jgi:AcrR family transcriptional regulator